MARALLLLAVLSASSSPSWAAQQKASLRAATNPIRKVVNLLQAMQKKVEEEGKREHELYDKFMCYCKTGGAELTASITAAEEKIPSLGAEIEASAGKNAQDEADLKQAQADRSSAEGAIAEATALREKEAAAFAAEKAEDEGNIAAIEKAVTALEKGATGGFLQTSAAQVLRRLTIGKTDMDDDSRQALVSFLTQGAAYAPQGGEIVGILKEIGDSMAKGLAEALAAEESSIKTFEEMVAAKKKELAALTQTIETKLGQIGDVGVAVTQRKEDLEDTQETLAEDKKFLAELDKNCGGKTAEWEARSKLRAEELVALADTIKVLNDDDALDLFKKTLPSASMSLVQVQMTASSMRARALAAVRAARRAVDRRDRAGYDLLLLTLMGKKALSAGGFEKVIQMCDQMVEVLKKEQKDDEEKKTYCGAELDSAEDKKKALEVSVADASTAIESAKEGVATLTQEVAALAEGIKALDKSVAVATEQRKAENTEYKDLMAADGAAKELLGLAKNRLNKFYNPKLFKAAPKTELSAQDRTAESFGEAHVTPAPGGIAGTGIGAVLVQISAHSQQEGAPAPPPETWGAYAKKSGETGGVVAMIDLLIADLDKEMTEAEAEEKNAQAEYEQMMTDSGEKRTADSKSLTAKEGTKADLEAQLEAHTQAKAATGSELMAAVQYIQTLHTECDWLLQYFDMRKQARADEIDALAKAKAVLSGADYAL